LNQKEKDKMKIHSHIVEKRKSNQQRKKKEMKKETKKGRK
jgi:hypothetical protein